MSWCCVFLIWTGFKGFSSWLLLFIKEWQFIHLRSNGEKRIKRNLDRWSLVVLATPLTANCDFLSLFLSALYEALQLQFILWLHTMSDSNTYFSLGHPHYTLTCTELATFVRLFIFVRLGWKGSIRRSCKKKKRKEKWSTKRFWAVLKSPCPWCNLNLNQKLESDWTK